MNQKRVLVWDNGEDCNDDHVVDFFDVTPLTDAEVVQLVACTERSEVIGEVIGHAVAYGSLHWFRGAAAPVGSILGTLHLSPAELRREDLGWARKVVAAMPDEEGWQRENKRGYSARIEELSRG